MEGILIRGGIELNGTTRAHVTIPAITSGCRIVLRSVSGPLQGTVVISEITSGVGFSLASTSDNDKGQTVVFDVFHAS
jgi:hypothetical protein